MKTKTILLVDDEEIILDSLGRDLDSEGYSVTKVASGEKALTYIGDIHYDLVITDLVMGGINGVRVLQEAKETNPETVVFILTGYGDMTSAIEALRLGADDYLLKPCDTEELLIRIGRCLEKQDTLKKVKIYEGILPVCCVCGVIRDDTGVEHGKGQWMKVDEFIHRKTTAEVSHTYCPICYEIALKSSL